jgi:hypothetical protein
MREYNVTFAKFVDETFVFADALAELNSKDIYNIPIEELISLSEKISGTGGKWLEYYSDLNSPRFNTGASPYCSPYRGKAEFIEAKIEPSTLLLGCVVIGYLSYETYQYLKDKVAKTRDGIANYVGATEFIGQARIDHSEGKITDEAYQRHDEEYRKKMDNGKDALGNFAKVTGGGVPGIGAPGEKTAEGILLWLDAGGSDLIKDVTSFIFGKSEPTPNSSLNPKSDANAGEVRGILSGEGFVSFFKGSLDSPFVFDVPKGEKNLTMSIVQGETEAPIQFNMDMKPGSITAIDLSKNPSVEDAKIGKCDEFPTEEEFVEEALSVTVHCNPPSPFEGQNVTATATVFPPLAGTAVTYSVIGTDGYVDGGTMMTNTNGQISFMIPGAEASVRDVVKVTIPNGASFQAVYSFRPLSNGALKVKGTSRVPKATK